MVNVAERLRVVIDDENARILSRSSTVSGGIGRRTGGGPSIAGSVNVNRLPWPGPPLAARMRPPWASTSPLLMARPGS